MRNIGAVTGAGILLPASAGCFGLGDDDDDIDIDDDNGIIDDDGEDDGDDVEDVGAGDPIPEFVFASYTVDEDPIRYETAVLTTEMWNELGIPVEHEPMEIGAILDMTFDEKNHDVMGVRRGGQAFRADPDFFLYDSYHSSQVGGAGTPNIAGFDDPDYDELVEAQRVADDPDERLDLVFEAQEYLAREVPDIQVMHQWRVHALNTERFQNPEPGLPGEGLFGWANFHQIEPTSDDVSTLTFGYAGGGFEAVNPMRPFPTQDYLYLNLIYDTAVRVTPEGDWMEWGAEQVERVDAETIDLAIRDDMEFHDGEPVTPEDVAFSFNYGVEQELGEGWGQVEEAEVGGDLDVRIHLEAPSATFEMMGLSRVYFVPQHIWEDIDDPLTLGSDEIDRTGSGIYEFDFWDPDDQGRLELFEDHWNPANVPELIFIPASGMSPIMRGFLDEDIDMVVWELNLEQIEDVEGTDFGDTYEMPDVGHHIISINQYKHEMFEDVALRRAMATAVPEEDIMAVTLGGLRDDGGYAEHNYSPITPGNEAWHNPDIPEEYRYHFDMEEARNILEEAGYTWDDEDRLHLPE